MKIKLLAVISILLMTVGGGWWIVDQRSQPHRLPVNPWQQNAVMSSPELPEAFHPPQPTLTTVFSRDHEWTASLSAAKTVTMIATGDVLTARTVNAKTVANSDFTWPFQQTAELLRQADITFINLETPLIKSCPVTQTGMVFCGDVRNVEGLTFAGVDMVNLANNHMGNYDIDGVDQTRQVLDQAGIAWTGITGPTIIERKGTRFAFLGYNEVDRQPGVPYPTNELIASEIVRAKESADVVIVQFHWGNEYTYRPSTNQQRLAHLAVDAGADLIIGNHPHWWQPIELYRTKVIAYSHGNFVFDQMWSQETREGMVGKYTFYEGILVDVEYIPVLIEDFGQPRWQTDQAAEEQLTRMQRESELLLEP